MSLQRHVGDACARGTGTGATGLPETGSQPHLCDLGDPLKPEFNGLISKVRAESRF